MLISCASSNGLVDGGGGGSGGVKPEDPVMSFVGWAIDMDNGMFNEVDESDNEREWEPVTAVELEKERLVVPLLESGMSNASSDHKDIGESRRGSSRGSVVAPNAPL